MGRKASNVRFKAMLVGLLCGLFAFAPAVAVADASLAQLSYTFTTTGFSPWLPLAGQTTCSVQLTGNGAGMTVVPQTTADLAANVANDTAAATTVTSIGQGSLTANGTYVGPITAQGLTGVRVNVSAISSGTETVVISCSPARFERSTQYGTLETSICADNVADVCAIVSGPNDNTGGDRGFASRGFLFGYNPNSTLWDRLRVDAGQTGVLRVTTGGSSNAAIAAATVGPTVVKNAAGRLVRLLVTSTGTASVTFYDNASACSGTIIGITPASTSVGQVYDFSFVANNGITACGAAGSPAVTVSYH